MSQTHGHVMPNDAMLVDSHQGPLRFAQTVMLIFGEEAQRPGALTVHLFTHPFNVPK